MSKIGYARASSLDQDTTIQVEALRAAGCTIIREEKASGTSMKGRTELQTILDFIGDGQALVVTRIDRLARSIADLSSIVSSLTAKGASLIVTEQPVNTGTPAGRAFLQMLGVFAEFENAIRRERQMEGISRAKAEGVYKGRKPSVDVGAVLRLKAEGKGATEIARELGIGRASVYRVLENGNTPSTRTTTAPCAPTPELANANENPLDPLSPLEQKILGCIDGQHYATPTGIARQIGVSRTTCASIMYGLWNQKYLAKADAADKFWLRANHAATS